MEKFKTNFRGYNKNEVNLFVTDVTKQFEKMLNSIKAKDQRLFEMEEKLDYYKRIEDSLNRAVMVAEEASNQIKRLAREESDNIVDNAKKNATRIINTALIKSEKIEDDAQGLKRQVVQFKRRFKAIIEEQLQIIEDIDEDL